MGVNIKLHNVVEEHVFGFLTFVYDNTLIPDYI